MTKYKKCYPGPPNPKRCFETKKKDVFMMPKNDAASWQKIGDALLTLADGTTNKPLPASGIESAADFINRVGAGNLQSPLPGWVKTVQYVRNDHDNGVFFIRLPDPDVIADAKAYSKDPNVPPGASYTKPPCYNTPTGANDAILKQIFAYYCISHCI